MDEHVAECEAAVAWAETHVPETVRLFGVWAPMPGSDQYEAAADIDAKRVTEYGSSAMEAMHNLVAHLTPHAATA